MGNIFLIVLGISIIAFGMNVKQGDDGAPISIGIGLLLIFIGIVLACG